jgi:hypothetical protein
MRSAAGREASSDTYSLSAVGSRTPRSDGRRGVVERSVRLRFERDFRGRPQDGRVAQPYDQTWLNSSTKIKSGDHLWVSYGSGSDHHRMIAEARSAGGALAHRQREAREGRSVVRGGFEMVADRARARVR